MSSREIATRTVRNERPFFHGLRCLCAMLPFFLNSRWLHVLVARVVAWAGDRLLPRLWCGPWLLGLWLLAVGGARMLGAQDAVLVLQPGPVVATLAGTGKTGHAGDGGAATAAALASPSAVVYDASGGLVFADTRNHAVRRIGSDGTIRTIAGTGRQGFAGDGGPAAEAELDSPLGVALATDGTLFIADTRNHRVRKVGTDGVITTVAGTGVSGFGGDLGSATAALLRSPGAVLVGTVGEVYVADTGNHRVRRIALDGTIRTVAGSGEESASGDGAPATSAGLDAPSGLAMRADGALLIADRLNSRVRVVTSDGLIASLPLNGGVASAVRRAAGVSVDAGGTVYVADTGHYQVRAVTANGSGVLLGSGGQGALETGAGAGTAMGAPYGVAADAQGGIAVTDRGNRQVQHLALPQVLFASTDVGRQSLVKTIYLANGGAESLTVSGVELPSGFVVASGGTCGNAPFVLATAGHCTLALAFAPSVTGAQSGMAVVTVGGGLAQRALLVGTAVPAGTATASSTVLQSSGSVSYVGVPLTLMARVIGGSTVAPTGTVVLMDASQQIGAVALAPDGTAVFVIASLTAGQHALVAQYSGDAHYAGSTSASVQETVAPAPDFTFSAVTPQVSVAAGGAATMLLTLQPLNGTLGRPVTFAYDGLPPGATVTVTPTPLMLASDAVTVTLAVQTVAGALRRTTGAVLLVAGMCLGLRRGLRECGWRIAGAVVLVGLVGVGGCSGGYLGSATTSGQTVAQTYPVTITATTTGVTGDPLVHTATFTLVVQ